MKLIKKLGTRKKKTGVYSTSWGLFSCSYCGVEVERSLGNGRRDKSCGCMRAKLIGESKVKHGDTKRDNKRPIYLVWRNIISRCSNPDSNDYKYYGGRGIQSCEEWQDYLTFREWALKNSYANGMQIDRIDNNGNYEPTNCRFVTCVENIRNSTTCKINIEIARKIRSKHASGNYIHQKLADKFKISRSSVTAIINNKSWKELESSQKQG